MTFVSRRSRHSCSLHAALLLFIGQNHRAEARFHVASPFWAMFSDKAHRAEARCHGSLRLFARLVVLLALAR